MSSSLLILFLSLSVTLVIPTTTSVSDTLESIAVLYDSTTSDGISQKSLLKGTFAGLRDSDYDSTLQPIFINLAEENFQTTLDWLKGNRTRTLISLLNSDQIENFSNFFISQNKKPPHSLRVFTPRIVRKNKNFDNKNTFSDVVIVTSLQMGLEAQITALLNRVKKIGIKILIPVIDDPIQITLVSKYKKIASKIIPKLQFLDPVYNLNDTRNENISLKFGFGFHSESDKGIDFQQGVLLLSTKIFKINLQKGLLRQDHFFSWFSHNWDSELTNILGLYSVQYVGSKNWDNPKRRRLLREFNTFTGPSPLIFSVALAYDTATLAVKYLRSNMNNNQWKPNYYPPIMTGLSGIIEFNSQGQRTNGIYFGISTLPKISTSFSTILQPSNWILEDSIQLKDVKGQIEMSQYQLATSSILTKNELLSLANKSQGEKRQCKEVQMDVLTHDPFNQMNYRFQFKPDFLPAHILIPNQYGYGLTFQCHGKDSVVTTLQIACTHDEKSIGEFVHCFKSRLHQIRKKRSPSSYSKIYNKNQWLESRDYSNSPYSRVSNYKNRREDVSPMPYYYQSPSYNSYSTGYSGYSSYDSSTPPTMVTRLDVPINEDPTTHSPFLIGGAKLPELRQILKAAKPFVGSCIGSTSGCAVCVLVLGRLPLGAVPAACTGPCFVGTFGTCGSLLGRVFSETTIICTELFQQGLLDVETFISDAEFGQKMAQESPVTLLGYHLLATPLVKKMKESEILSRVVAYFALPWAQHMKYLMGTSEEFNWLGYWVHTVGSSLCGLIGKLMLNFTLPRHIESLGYSVGAVLLGVVLLVRRLKK